MYNEKGSCGGITGQTRIKQSCVGQWGPTNGKASELTLSERGKSAKHFENREYDQICWIFLGKKDHSRYCKVVNLEDG